MGFIEIPRGDIDGVGEENRERHPGGGAKIRSQVKWLRHVGARRGTVFWKVVCG